MEHLDIFILICNVMILVAITTGVVFLAMQRRKSSERFGELQESFQNLCNTHKENTIVQVERLSAIKTTIEAQSAQNAQIAHESAQQVQENIRLVADWLFAINGVIEAQSAQNAQIAHESTRQVQEDIRLVAERLSATNGVIEAQNARNAQMFAELTQKMREDIRGITGSVNVLRTSLEESIKF